MRNSKQVKSIFVNQKIYRIVKNKIILPYRYGSILDWNISDILDTPKTELLGNMQKVKLNAADKIAIIDYIKENIKLSKTGKTAELQA